MINNFLGAFVFNCGLCNLVISFDLANVYLYDEELRYLFFTYDHTLCDYNWQQR